jgi:hypothetical protein
VRDSVVRTFHRGRIEGRAGGGDGRATPETFTTDPKRLQQILRICCRTPSSSRAQEVTLHVKLASEGGGDHPILDGAPPATSSPSPSAIPGSAFRGEAKADLRGLPSGGRRNESQVRRDGTGTRHQPSWRRCSAASGSSAYPARAARSRCTCRSNTRARPAPRRRRAIRWRAAHS